MESLWSHCSQPGLAPQLCYALLCINKHCYYDLMVIDWLYFLTENSLLHFKGCLELTENYKNASAHHMDQLKMGQQN